MYIYIYKGLIETCSAYMSGGSCACHSLTLSPV